MKHRHSILIGAILAIIAWLLIFFWAAKCDAGPSASRWYGPPQNGVAVHYAASWDWDRIAARQGVTVPEGFTPVAHWDCSTLGRTALLQLGTGEHFIPCIVADCTAPAHVALVRGRKIVVEVPFDVAQEYGFAGGRIEARLYLEER
jgi:hypothetical protein